MSKKKSNSSRRGAWSPEDLEGYYKRQGRQVPESTRKILEDLGLESRLRPQEAPSTPLLAVPDGSGQLPTPAKKKRRGVSVRPIVNSLRSAFVSSRADEGPMLGLWFDGARLLTVNELFSIYQYRKYETYAYKKAWKNLVENALLSLPRGQSRPKFDGPTRLWLYRRGTRLVDLDALPTMFKYAVDALRTHGVIPDDNPEIIVDVRFLQEKGKPTVAIRLERLHDWETEDLGGLKERWVG